MYDLENILRKEIKDLKEKIKDIKPIAVQIPEGLKTKATFILEALDKNQPLLFIDPCYGACDLKDTQAKQLRCKAIVHFGHYPIGKKHDLTTFFVPIGYKLKKKDIDYVVKKILEKYSSKKINLLTTTQYLNNIQNIKKRLIEKNVCVQDAQKTNRLEKHMVLGCDCSTIINKNADFVFIGDGLFHARNLYFRYNKDVFIINPITKETKTLKKDERFLRQRYGAIASAKKANKFGIIVSTKKGQTRTSLAKEMCNLLKKNNKKAYVFSCDTFVNDKVLGIDVDCYINTACPRITYDDYKNYNKPVISCNEAKIILNKEKKLKIDQIS